MVKTVDSEYGIDHICSHRRRGPQKAPAQRQRCPGSGLKLFTQLGNIAAGSASAYSAINKFPAPCQLWNWPWLHMQPREVAQPPPWKTPVADQGLRRLGIARNGERNIH